MKQELKAGIAYVLTATEIERPSTNNSFGTIIYLQGFYLHRTIHCTQTSKDKGEKVAVGHERQCQN